MLMLHHLLTKHNDIKYKILVLLNIIMLVSCYYTSVMYCYYDGKINTVMLGLLC